MRINVHARLARCQVDTRLMPRARTRLETSELRAAIFGGLESASAAALEDRFSEWAGSSRFRAFAATYRDKMRKTLRLVRDVEGLRDLELELDVAARLLQDRRFTVEYERHAASGRRSPDLAVTFRERTLLHLEVKRVRTTGADPEAKCAEVICDAVQQLVPNAVNALAIGFPPEPATTPDLAGALRALRRRAERKDEVYFQRRGFIDARHFRRSLERLGAIVTIVDSRGAQLLATNPLARPPMPADVSRAIATVLGSLRPPTETGRM